MRLEIHYLSIYGLRWHVLNKRHKTLADYNEDDNIKFAVDLEVNKY